MRLALLCTLAVLSPLACSDPVTLDDAACPCTTGYICCSDDHGGTCVRDVGGGKVSCPKSRAVSTFPVDSGVRQLSTTSVTKGFACATADAEAIYWMDQAGRFGALATPASHVTVKIKPFMLPATTLSSCSIAQDDDSLYVTLPDPGAILRLSVRHDANGDLSIGDEAVRFGAFGSPTAVVVDATYAYVIDSDAKGTSGAIKRVAIPKNGQASTNDVTTLASTGASPDNLTLVDQGLLWTDQGGTLLVPTAGGAIRAVLPTVMHDPRMIGDRLFYRDAFNGLMSRRLTSRDASVRLTSNTSVDRFGSDGSAIFFSSKQSLYRVELDGGDATEELVYRKGTSTDQLLNLFVDPDWFLWTTEDGGIWWRERSSSTSSSTSPTSP